MRLKRCWMSNGSPPPGRQRGPHDVSPRAIAIIFAVMFGGLALGMLLVMPHYGPRKPRHRSALGHTVPTSMIGRETNGMVYIPGGLFLMGSNEEKPDEAPVHEVTVAPVWMDKTEVTNEQFSKFVAATGYVTLAERKKSEADWRHPAGPSSAIEGKELYPVVQVAWEDAAAFAKWAGKRLPTEAEWEHAARGGLHQKGYVWGSEKPTEKELRGNLFGDAATNVASFPPNDFGLMDMAGNVSEWCSDWYATDYYKNSPKLNPKGPDQPRTGRIVRGGSFRSSASHEEDFRPAARSSAPPETKRPDLGFRCAKDAF
jgi:sulfatase modifying factor 1